MDNCHTISEDRSNYACGQCYTTSTNNHTTVESQLQKATKDLSDALSSVPTTLELETSNDALKEIKTSVKTIETGIKLTKKTQMQSARLAVQTNSTLGLQELHLKSLESTSIYNCRNVDTTASCWF
jgi:hypothetical protein